MQCSLSLDKFQSLATNEEIFSYFPTYTAGEIEHYLCINKKSILKLTH